MYVVLCFGLCIFKVTKCVYMCIFIAYSCHFVTYVLYDGNKIWNLDYNHSNTLSSIVSEKPHFDSKILTTVDKRHEWRVQSKWPWLATNWKIYCHLSLVWEEIPSFSSPFFHSQLHMSVDCVQNQMQLLSQKKRFKSQLKSCLEYFPRISIDANKLRVYWLENRTHALWCM